MIKQSPLINQRELTGNFYPTPAAKLFVGKRRINNIQDKPETSVLVDKRWRLNEISRVRGRIPGNFTCNPSQRKFIRLICEQQTLLPHALTVGGCAMFRRKKGKRKKVKERREEGSHEERNTYIPNWLVHVYVRFTRVRSWTAPGEARSSVFSTASTHLKQKDNAGINYM